jgi:hypothetical protein
VSAALAARENQAVDVGEIVRASNVAMRSAEAVERLGVRFVITLNCENADFHVNTESIPTQRGHAKQSFREPSALGEFQSSTDCHQPRV